MEGDNEKLKEFEARKLVLIEKYMKMQDEADEMNERIYLVCCEIEALNLSISKEKEEEAKRKAIAAKAVLHPPANGRTHDKSHAPSKRDPADR